jgi:hypothetical protein
MARRTMAPPTDLGKASHEFIYHRDVAADATKVKDKARDLIKGWLTLVNQAGKMPNGREDSDGHRYLDFDHPLTIGDKTYTGIKAQLSRPTPYIDLDAAAKLLESKGTEFYDQVFKRKVIREFDGDELYVLNQKGIVSDDELDALEVQGKPSYSLIPVAE